MNSQVYAHRKEEPLPQSPPPGSSIPTFYFPLGRPPLRPQDADDIIALVECTFEGLPRGRAGLGDMAVVAKVRGQGLTGWAVLNKVGRALKVGGA